MNFLQEVRLDGFEVVQGQLFTRQTGPAMTIRRNNISFNISAYDTLNRCESVQILVNLQRKCIVIKPSNSSDPNSIKWIKPGKTPSGTWIECTPFCKHLIQAWGWDPEKRYRTIGHPVASDNKLMLFFDWSKPEIYEKAKKNA